MNPERLGASHFLEGRSYLKRRNGGKMEIQVKENLIWRITLNLILAGGKFSELGNCLGNSLNSPKFLSIKISSLHPFCAIVGYTWYAYLQCIFHCGCTRHAYFVVFDEAFKKIHSLLSGFGTFFPRFWMCAIWWEKVLKEAIFCYTIICLSTFYEVKFNSM